MFSSLTSGCRFDAKQREQQRRLFRGDPSSSKAQREAADLGSLDFFGGADAEAAAASSSAKTDDEAPVEKSSRAARRRRARKAAEAEAEAADTPAPVPEALPAADAVSDALSEREQADANALRRALRIHVYGTNPPAPVQCATEMADRFAMRPALRRNVLEAGYHELTRVQMQSIPSLMARRDLVACAPTGSGKTAAFAIPLLAQLGAPKRAGLRAIVLAPTQELARQTYRELLKLSQGASLGVCVLTKKLGTSAAAAQKGQALRRYDVMVCTPLRLVSLLEKEVLSLHTVTLLVMDEADKLLELGFLSQVDSILASCTHAQLQRACFSATMLPAVEDLATTVLKDAVRVVVGDKNAAAETVAQKLVFCGREDGKLLALRSMVREGLTPPVLIFVQSKERAVQLFNELVYDNLNVDVMHAERSQAQRDAVIDKFRTGKVWVLIATELMARGIDFKGVATVVNYDFPQTTVSYIHRIGRTGRAGRAGRAVTFFTEDDVEQLRSIANVMKASGCDVPDWMLRLQPMRKDKRKRLATAPKARKAIRKQPRMPQPADDAK